jgi:hypothetical protein
MRGTMGPGDKRRDDSGEWATSRQPSPPKSSRGRVPGTHLSMRVMMKIHDVAATASQTEASHARLRVGN